MQKYIVQVSLFLCLTCTAASVGAVYFSDMSQCTPVQVLSSQPQLGKWHLIQYQCDEVTGTMAGAASYNNAPELTIPLNLTGWYSVYLGYWNPGFDEDGSSVVLKAKFTGDAAFRQMHEFGSSDTTQATYLREVFFEDANLTGKNLVCAKANGVRGAKLYLAYVKCVPLTQTQITAAESDRARTDTRNLIATIDGMSFYHYSQYDAIDHFKEQIGLYKYSDVGKIFWAINYGHITNFHSSVPGARWMGSLENRIATLTDFPSNDYTRGEKQTFDVMRNFDASGTESLNEIAALTHSMGRKIDIMSRLGIISGVWPDPNNYVNAHPQFRQKLKDGTVIGKASYAYPEVRQFMLSIIQDAAVKFDIDGVNLCFVRGPSLVQYEQPVIDAFIAAYGIDPRQIAANDPRIGTIRALFVTQFVQNVRAMLDTVGTIKGKHLELSVWVWPSNQNVWLGKTPFLEGLDVPAWISQGLLDSVVCQEGIDVNYMQLCQQYGCKFVLYTGYSGEQVMSPAHITQAYNAGVENFAFWDIDSWQISPAAWSWIRRIGHADEMAVWNDAAHQVRSVQLKILNGSDVFQSLSDAVYSGQ